MIYDVKVNGWAQPMGCAFEDVVFSWKVKDPGYELTGTGKILVARDEALQEVEAAVEGPLDSRGQAVSFPLKPRTAYYARISLMGKAGEALSSEIIPFETGKREEPWMGRWIGQKEGEDFHPVFEKRLTLEKEIKKARLYLCGLGLYEASINGRKVGESYLTPYFNDYRYGLQAQTYDVTAMLVQGENCLSVLLGKGWYMGRLGYEGGRAVFGNRFMVIGELHLEYTDGSRETVGTDESWEYRGSDIRESDIYDGEIIDRLLYEGKENPGRPAVLIENQEELTARLTDCRSIPLKAMEEREVQEILETPSGERVLDFGQNFSGFVSFLADFPKGTCVTLDHGEILQDGCFYHENYRTAKTRVTYVSDGRREWVSPRFTYMGFRYVRVTGWPGELKKEDFKGIVLYSAMERTGYLKTGHEKVNRLIANALWGMKSNFLDMPTDCPQRDERLGWTGDAQVFAPTASFFMDTKAFYRKFLWDMRCDQLRQEGAVANYLPNFMDLPGGSSVWGDAAVFIPYELYQVYGDVPLLRELYPLMKDWVEWIRRGDEARPGGPKHLFDYAFTFGDWLAMDGVTEQSFKGGTEDGYVSSVYYYASVRKTEEAAGLLGYEADRRFYGKLAERIREAILEEYITPSGRLAVDTQTGYVIALRFGLWRDKEALKRGLKRRLKLDGYRLKCGFVGAPLICETLADNGMERLALFLLLQEGFPGWLHCVSLGATTIWERWNSVLDDGRISGTGMNSLNHYAYGSVVNYIKCHIAGLKAAEPGFRRARIAPCPDVRIGFVKCTYESAYGTYRADWEIQKDGKLRMYYQIPWGCEAEVILPEYEEGREWEVLAMNGRMEGGRLLLTAGVTEVVYEPKRDYRLLYGWDTLLEELAGDPRAMEILEEELPAACAMAKSGDLENLTTSLGELKYMGFLGFQEEEVDRAAKRLFTLRKE